MDESEKSSFEEKESTMGLRVTYKDADGKTCSKYEAYSNYVATPVAEVIIYLVLYFYIVFPCSKYV